MKTGPQILLVALLASGLTLTALDPKEKEKPEALLSGSVFTAEGFALPGIAVSIKHQDDRKPRWRAVSDSRGEFVVHLPAGAARYEVTTRSKHHENQTKTVEVRDREVVMVIFRLSEKEEK
jgi:hypothetical protein